MRIGVHNRIIFLITGKKKFLCKASFFVMFFCTHFLVEQATSAALGFITSCPGFSCNIYFSSTTHFSRQNAAQNCGYYILEYLFES